MTWSCCGRWFETERSFYQHQTYSSRHRELYCELCNLQFYFSEDIDDHLAEDKNHWPEDALECCYCDSIFRYTSERNCHLVDVHHVCLICEKSFVNSRALEQHVASPVHRPADKFCPFCKMKFTTYSAIAAHIESSRCVKYVSNPVHLCSVIRGWESSVGIQGTYTKNLLTYGHGQRVPRVEYDFESTWNDYCCMYECPLCDYMFSSTSEVRSHVYGSAHASQALYHCPTCRKEVISLQALLLHLELSQCGKTKTTALGGIVNGMKMIQR